MLTWSNHSTTGEHFAFLCDYKLRINVCTSHFTHILDFFQSSTCISPKSPSHSTQTGYLLISAEYYVIDNKILMFLYVLTRPSPLHGVAENTCSYANNVMSEQM